MLVLPVSKPRAGGSPPSRSSAETVSFVQVRPRARARSGPPYTAVRTVGAPTGPPPPHALVFASTSSLENKLEADLFGQTRCRVAVGRGDALGKMKSERALRLVAVAERELASRTSVSSDGGDWARTRSVVVDMFHGCVAFLSN